MKKSMPLIIIVLLSHVSSIGTFIQMDQNKEIKNKAIQQELVKRLRNTNQNTDNLIKDFDTLPTQCHEEIKKIIEHFRK